MAPKRTKTFPAKRKRSPSPIDESETGDDYRPSKRGQNQDASYEEEVQDDEEDEALEKVKTSASSSSRKTSKASKSTKASRASNKASTKRSQSNAELESGDEEVEKEASKPKKLSPTQALMAKYLAEGKRLAEENEETDWAPAGRHKKADPRTEDYEKKWIESLAQHLACEDAFINMMRNRPQIAEMTFVGTWPASIYLPFRFARFPGDQPFASWIRKKKQPIIERAIELYDAVTSHDQAQTKMEGSVLPLPDMSEPTLKLRDSLIRVHQTRQGLVAAVKSADLLQSLLATRFLRSSNASSSTRQAIWDKLEGLDRFIQASRKLLSASEISKTGVSILDHLLVQMPAAQDVSQLPSTTTTSTAEVDKDGQSEELLEPETVVDGRDDDGDDAKYAEDIRTKVQQIAPFTCGYMLDRAFGDNTDKVIQFKAAPMPKLGKAQQRSVGMLGADGLGKAEKTCASWLASLAGDIDQSRFSVNFRTLEAVVKRNSTLTRELAANHAKKHSDFTNNLTHPRFWLYFVYDNLFHVRYLITIAHKEGLITGTNVEMILRRMIALVSLIYGCFAEGALWLSVMDHLLEDLATQFQGTVQEPFTTISKASVKNAIQSGASAITIGPETDTTLVGQLERDFRARQIFAELAGFFRGAVLLAYGASARCTSWNSRKERQAWFEGMLAISQQCGHLSCREEVQIEEQKDKKHRKFGISIGVRDSRQGFPTERAEISDDRREIYPCLILFTHSIRYHPGHVPFFHYYAHLYHTACKPFLGKKTIIDDLRAGDRDAGVDNALLAESVY